MERWAFPRPPVGDTVRVSVALDLRAAAAP
jgi:hypothetical protein